MANIIDINDCGHIFVSIFALSIFEHKMSEVLKGLGVSSNKLLPGEDTDTYYQLRSKTMSSVTISIGKSFPFSKITSQTPPGGVYC
jgi:hypothetical protein